MILCKKQEDPVMSLTHDLLIRTTILTCLFSNVVGAPRIKRAEPFPNGHYGTVKNRTDTSSTKDGLKDELIQTVCPIGQLLQQHGNQSICCQPVICQEGFEIRTCSDNGEEDVCVACEEKYLQLNNISSFNMEEASCFEDAYPKENSYASASCPPEDTKSAKDQPVNCGMYCECHTERCYVGNPCGCTKVEPCGFDQQLNKHTHKCEACPSFSYKHHIGCGRCAYNLTAFRQGETIESSKPTSSSTVTTTSTVTTSRAMPNGTGVTSTVTFPPALSTLEIILIVVVTLFGLLVVGSITFCLLKTRTVTCRLAQKMCPNDSASTSYTNSPRPVENSQVTLTETVPSENDRLLQQTNNNLIVNLPKNVNKHANRQDSGFEGSIIEYSPTSDVSVLTRSLSDNTNVSTASNFSETSDNQTITLDRVSRPELTSLVTQAEPNIKDEPMNDSSIEDHSNPCREQNGQSLLKSSKTETQGIRPIARVCPMRQPASPVNEDSSELASSITSYPSIGNGSVGRMEDLNSMPSNTSTQQNWCICEGNPVSGRHSPEGVSALVSHGHQTACKEVVDSDETPRKSVYNDQVSDADVISSNNSENDRMTKVECLKEIELSHMHATGDESTDSNQASEEDSFGAILPSDSVEISRSETQFISDDASVEIEYSSTARHDHQPGRQHTRGLTHDVNDTQPSVISPNCVRETGDGADSECQDSVELDIVSSL